MNKKVIIPISLISVVLIAIILVFVLFNYSKTIVVELETYDGTILNLGKTKGKFQRENKFVGDRRKYYKIEDLESFINTSKNNNYYINELSTEKALVFKKGLRFFELYIINNEEIRISLIFTHYFDGGNNNDVWEIFDFPRLWLPEALGEINQPLRDDPEKFTYFLKFLKYLPEDRYQIADDNNTIRLKATAAAGGDYKNLYNFQERDEFGIEIRNTGTSYETEIIKWYEDGEDIYSK